MNHIIFSLVCGLATDYFLHRHFKQFNYPWTCLLSLAACTALLITFDNPIGIIKGIIFVQMLIIVGYCDAKTHEIPDILLIPIALLGFIQFQPLMALIGLFAVSLPMLLVAKVTNGGVGGGDVKLMAASGFLLGAGGSVAGTIVGLTLFLILYPIFYRNKKKKAYAMAPYLGMGCSLAYILQI